MSNWSHLQDFRVVRLNAELSPMPRYERDLFREHHLNPLEVEANTPATIIPRVAECDAIFVVSTALPEGVIESLSRCRVISCLGTGTDKIDVAAATRRGMLVTNVPSFCVEEQADHTMALLLALLRKLPQMSQAMSAGAWSRARRQASANQRLAGRVLGLIGFGNSARAVAQRAQGFGLRVIATRRNMDAPRDAADELGVEMTSLEDLLAQSDYVSLHLPLIDETYHLLDGAMLRTMKPGAYLTNRTAQRNAELIPWPDLHRPDPRCQQLLRQLAGSSFHPGVVIHVRAVAYTSVTNWDAVTAAPAQKVVNGLACVLPKQAP